jgi:hypothetical protein
MRWVGPVECIEEMRNAYKVLVGKSDGIRPCRRAKHRWEVIIIMDFREIECEGVDWIQLA